MVLFRIMHTSWSFILLLLIIARAKLNPSKSKQQQRDDNQKEPVNVIASRYSLNDAASWFKSMGVVPKVHLLFGLPICISLSFYGIFPRELLSSKLLNRIWYFCAAVFDAAGVSACMWMATAVQVSTYLDQESQRTAWLRTHVMLSVVRVLQCALHQLKFQGEDYTLSNGTYASLSACVFDLSLFMTVTRNWIRVRRLRRCVVCSL